MYCCCQSHSAPTSLLALWRVPVAGRRSALAWWLAMWPTERHALHLAVFGGEHHHHSRGGVLRVPARLDACGVPLPMRSRDRHRHEHRIIFCQSRGHFWRLDRGPAACVQQVSNLASPCSLARLLTSGLMDRDPSPQKSGTFINRCAARPG